MKAVCIHSYGSEDVLRYEEVPVPELGDRDVLIRVFAAAINPVDWKIREGYLQGMLNHKLPLILGWDVSGVIEQIGARVTEFKVGDEVYSRPDINRDGAYAEYIAVNVNEVAFKPQSINHIQAAAVPLAGITAWQSLFAAAKLEANQNILIHAAAGGVGSFAVQLACWKGARVIGTASANNREFLSELGAHEIIDYKAVNFEDIVKDVDVVFDTIGGDVQERSWQVLKPEGVLVSVVNPPDGEKAASYNCRSEFVFIEPNAVWLTEMAKLIDGGQFKPIVSTILPLTEARQAHIQSRSGHTRGKIVLQIVE